MGTEQRGEVLNPIKVDFDRKAHVYDIRSGKYLGYTNTADAKIASGDTLLFSLLPYRVEKVGIKAAPAVDRGSDYRAEIA